MNKEKNEKCMQAPTFEEDIPNNIDAQKWLRKAETLQKLGYEWSSDYQVWASKTNYLLPVLNNSQAQALVNSIYEFLK